jgi:hypothetical protein
VSTGDSESEPDVERPAGSPAADRVLLAAVVGAVLPIVAAAVARVGSHWEPSSDEAAIARLSHDVLSSHSPLLGMPSTVGLGVKLAGAGTPHHLGPMLFWLFAIPDRLSGSSPAALAITIALVNIASIVAIAWQVRRRASASAAVIAMFAIMVMLWSVGRDLTVQIWNPYAALLPLLLFLVLSWSVACGDLVVLPFAALVGSFVMQCHILYALPVVSVGLVATGAFLLAERTARAERDELRRRTRRRACVATGVVIAACWWTAAYDQIVHRPGNLTRLSDSIGGSPQKPFGTLTALRYLARAIAIPPLFARRLPDVGSFLRLGTHTSLVVDATAIVVLAALAIGTVAAWRRGAAEAKLGLLALVTLASSTFVLARLPREYGGVSVYRARFLWIVGVYSFGAAAALGAAAASEISARHDGKAHADATIRIALSVVVAIVALGGGALAARQRSPAYAVLPDETVAIRRLSSQIRARVPRGSTYLLGVDGYRSFGSVGFGVMWDLVRHGYDIRVLAGDPYLGSAHGLPRRAPVPTLLVVSTGPRFVAPPGASRVAAFVADPSLAQRLTRSEAALVEQLDRRPPSLTAFGRRTIRGTQRDEGVDGLRAIAAGRADWRRLLDNHVLRALVLTRLVTLPADEVATLSRFDDLLNSSDDAYLFAFVIPSPT